MKNIKIIKVENDEEFCELKFLLYARNFINISAYYVNKPILIDFNNKTFDNIEISNKTFFKKEDTILNLTVFKSFLTKKNLEIEK